MSNTVSILDGNTFLVTDRRGDLEPSASDANLELTGIPGRWDRSDAFGRGRIRLAERRPELAVRV
jgi:hypothetical protein